MTHILFRQPEYQQAQRLVRDWRLYTRWAFLIPNRYFHRLTEKIAYALIDAKTLEEQRRVG